MPPAANVLMLGAVAAALMGCGRSRAHDLAACRAASGGASQASAAVAADEIGACMQARGYRRNTYTNGCAPGGSGSGAAAVRADCWRAPGEPPSNYPFPRDNH